MAQFECGKCHAKFATRDQLRVHIFNKHLYPDRSSRPATMTEDAVKSMAQWEIHKSTEGGAASRR
ncbi:MAG: hypothetical protein JNM30_19155 [Rhodospirillales bacterium]|nr:hypothetical protein [Rhodospirillales bacterium]